MTATVDGQPWTSVMLREDTIARVAPTLDTLDMLGVDSISPTTYKAIHIVVRQLTGTGAYQLQFFVPAEAYFISYAGGGSQQYVTTSLDTGIVTIDTLDNQSHRLRGTFHFIAAIPNTNPERTVRVTNGRFVGHFEVK